MNFITDLPPNSGEGTVFNSILVIINRYTKFAQYIPIKKTIITEELTIIFEKHIFTTFSAPNDIINDRDSIFTSHFWSTLYYHIKINKRLFIVFHPQTDDQTE